jgi:aspartokinase-like uncharacterized kinase
MADVVALLRQWLAGQDAAVNVIVVGGGRLAEAIREYDKLHALGEFASHWLCIRAMSINAELVATLVPEVGLTSSLLDVCSHAASGPIILDPWQFLRHEEPNLRADPLPASWHMTSDSIAARVAEILEAEELVLLKSALPPPPATLAGAAAAGYVDRYFPIAAARLRRIRCVNLASADFANLVMTNDQ